MLPDNSLPPMDWRRRRDSTVPSAIAKAAEANSRLALVIERAEERASWYERAYTVQLVRAARAYAALLLLITGAQAGCYVGLWRLREPFCLVDEATIIATVIRDVVS